MRAQASVFEERVRQEQIKLETTVATRVPSHVAGDVKRLRQILLNLLNNATKHRDADEVRVNPTAEALDASTGRQRLNFPVRDTGAGMPSDRAADEIEALFGLGAVSSVFLTP